MVVVQPLILYAFPVDGLPPLYATVTPPIAARAEADALMAPLETVAAEESKLQYARL